VIKKKYLNYSVSLKVMIKKNKMKINKMIIKKEKINFGVINNNQSKKKILISVLIENNNGNKKEESNDKLIV